MPAVGASMLEGVSAGGWDAPSGAPDRGWIIHEPDDRSALGQQLVDTLNGTPPMRPRVLVAQQRSKTQQIRSRPVAATASEQHGDRQSRFGGHPVKATTR